MRNGTVIINGTNIGSAYNTYVSRGGYKELVQWPALKPIVGNDWQELDGYEPDLACIRLDTRDLNINFVCLGTADNMSAFYTFLLSSTRLTCEFQSIGRTVTLRLISMPSLSEALLFQNITVRFAADSPLENYTYVAPSSSLQTKRDYSIDGTWLSSYGVRVLKGTMNSAARRADVKPFLLRNTSNISGALYDSNPIVPGSAGSGYEEVTVPEGGNWKRKIAGGSPTVRARDFTLRCLLRDAEISNGWRNYDALLYDLTKSGTPTSTNIQEGARTIVMSPISASFLCYYKSQSVTEFTTDGSDFWLKFDLTLTLFQEEGSTSFF